MQRFFVPLPGAGERGAPSLCSFVKADGGDRLCDHRFAEEEGILLFVVRRGGGTAFAAQRHADLAAGAALARVFGNIISNAVRYSNGDFCVEMKENGEILFENSASALDEVSAKRLFDRFFTVENARGSTGLGLSIAKLFVERMNGSIGASWSEGRLCIRMKL